MENDSTREYRHTFAEAVEEYRAGVNEDPENERDVAHDVADKYNITQRELRERAEAGA